ncbi:uncharacterized protein [Littorina saxatilis]|uniref:uncharacterized protein n=1 Tax=Littorina saxatilis TaxID=31220 RepID=UPI0038B59FA1
MDKLLDLIPMMQNLGTRLEHLESGLMGKKLEEKIEEVVDRKLAEMMEEQKEVEKRKNNLILVNVKESTRIEIEEKKEDDIEAAKHIFGMLVDIEEGDVVEPVRLGKVGGSAPRMLRVTIRNEEKKKEIMRKAPTLNRGTNDRNKKVYINHDQTPMQRQKYKDLRVELDQRAAAGEKNLVIRQGKIVERKTRTKTVDNNEQTAVKDDATAASKGTSNGRPE